MGKGLIVFLVIGAAMAYILIGFVNKLEDEDDRLKTQDKLIEQHDKQFYQKDVIGQNILVFKKDTPYSEKVAVWKRSPLREEFLDLVPNFEEMKHFARDRVLDKEFSKKLLEKVDKAEDDYFSGKISEQVRLKEGLDTF